MVISGGDRPPRLGGAVVAFEDMREFLVVYSVYTQQMCATNKNGVDGVLARRRGLVDSATQRMVDDEFYDGKPCIDLSEEEVKNGLETFAGVDVQQTSDQVFATRSCV